MEKTMRARSIALGLTLVALAGCVNGHGKETSKEMTRANNVHQGIKAGNDYQQAEQAYMAGDLDKAMKMVDKSLMIRPDVVKSHVLKGRILLEKSDLENSVNEFQMAEGLDPKCVEAHYYQGIVFERFQQQDKALEQYKKAAELEPSNAQHAVAAAEVMVDMGRIDEAEEYLNSRSSVFEHNAGVRQTLGHIAMLKGDPQKAVDLFNQARLLAPDDPIVLEDLVNAQIATNQFAEAEFTLTRLTKDGPNKDRRDLKQLRARCLMRLDRPVEAREILIQLTQGDEGQKDVESWIELGNLSYMLKDQNRLRNAASRVIAMAPDRPEGFTLKAMWQWRGGEAEAALQTLSKAIERRGHRVEPLLLEGVILSDRGRCDEARGAFQAALADDPENAEAKRALQDARIAGVPETP
jgi:Flp pilus assembly protein TadD